MYEFFAKVQFGSPQLGHMPYLYRLVPSGTLQLFTVTIFPPVILHCEWGTTHMHVPHATLQVEETLVMFNRYGRGLSLALQELT